MKGFRGYERYFYINNCQDCKYDNEDADATCEILKKIMEGVRAPSKCKKLKRRNGK